MEIKKNNIKEDFLISLLNTTDSVYFSGVTSNTNEEYFYFYPHSLGFTVQIPVAPSDNVDILFVVDEPGTSGEKEKKTVVFSAGKIKDVPNFLKQLYGKHEDMLNCVYNDHTHIISDVQKILTSPISSLPATNDEGERLQLKVVEDMGNYQKKEIIIRLGEPLFWYDTPRSLAPLKPLVFQCLYKGAEDPKYTLYKKVIPTYMIDEYPIVKQYAKPLSINDDIHALSDELLKLSSKAGKLLTKIILDLELPTKEEVKIKQNKI